MLYTEMDQVNYSFQYAIHPVTPKIDLPMEKDHIMLIFSPENNIHLCLLEIDSVPINISNGHCLAFLAPHDQCMISLIPHTSNPIVTCILVFHKRQIPHTVLEQFSKEGEKGRPIVTFNNSRIEFLLNELTSLENSHNCKFKMYSILLELVSLQLERVSNEGTNISGQVHYDKILYAKRLIEENLSHTYTIPELAKFAGTNEQYLKKYFKLYLGTTISHYTLEVKMDFAKHMLMTGKHRIADIARMIGYKHSTHFTTAFKRHFGFIPNSIRY